MRLISNHQIKFKIVSIFALLAFASTTFASGLSVGRIIPKGKVTLFHGNQKVGEFSSEAPFPEDTLLSVQGECGVKMSDLYLVAIDKSLFSVKTYYDSRKYVRQKRNGLFCAFRNAAYSGIPNPGWCGHHPSNFDKRIC